MAEQDLHDDPPNEDKPLEAVEITIDDGSPAVDPKATPATPAIIPAQEGLDQIKADLQRQRDATAREARLRADAEQRANAATAQVGDSNLSLIENAMSAAQARIANAERDYQTAAEAGDWARAAKAQTAISAEAARLVQLESGKYQIEQERAQRKSAPQTQPSAVSDNDPVEQFARASSPQAAAWIRAHPDSVADQTRQQNLMRAHHSALGEGYAGDTPEYFAHIERKLGYVADQARVPQRQQPQRQASVAAPVSRDIPSTTGEVHSARVMTLSPEERAQARREGMTDKEWAKAKAALMDSHPSYGRTH